VRGAARPLRSGRRLAALHWRHFFGHRATLSQMAVARHGQPAPGGGIVVSPRWSPGSPGPPADEAERAGAAQAGRATSASGPGRLGLFSGRTRPACSIIRTSPVDAPWSSKATRNMFLDHGGSMEKISPRAFPSPRACAGVSGEKIWNLCKWLLLLRSLLSRDCWTRYKNVESFESLESVPRTALRFTGRGTASGTSRSQPASRCTHVGYAVSVSSR
jgi:hypothetical protein